MANPPADKIRVICVICGEKELPKLQLIINSSFGYIFTTDCTDYTDFSSQEATMAGCRTIRMAGAAEAQKSV